MSHADLKGAIEPKLRGLSIAEFGKLCNLISTSGTRGKPGFIHSAGGKSQTFHHSMMGVPLMFEAKRDWEHNGYTLQYEVSSRADRIWWGIKAWGSTFPPGNTDRSAGHYWNTPFDLIRFSYLPGQAKERFVFDFSLIGDEDRYCHDMALIRLML